MLEFIIEQSGFPKNRPTLQEFQNSFKYPLNRILEMLPGAHVMEGCATGLLGNGTMFLEAGVIAYNGKLWTVEPYNGAPNYQLSFIETIEQANFNTGTREIPVETPADFAINRTAQVGTIAGRVGDTNLQDLYRDRSFVEYFDRGSTYIGIRPPVKGTTTYVIPHSFTTTSDYFVVGKLRGTTTNPVNINIPFYITDYTSNNFKLNIPNHAFSTALTFDWMLIATNREYARRTSRP